MRLLLDRNLSYRLALRLRDIYPDSAHVRALATETAPDITIAQLAIEQDFVLVSKDGDFAQIVSEVLPELRVIWLTSGNAATNQQIEQQLRSQRIEIERHFTQPGAGPFVL